MNWPAVFLGCFVVGFVLSALSFAMSAIDLHFHLNVPFIHHLHLPYGHPAPNLAHVVHGGGHAGHGLHGAHDGVPVINFPTMMAFLAWFGGTGYLLTSQFGWWAIPALTLATAAGLAGAAIVFWVMARVLWSPEENMQGADYQMVGVLGRLSNPIREAGTGELIYSHGGTRHSCGARSADGHAIEKGAEVVVTAYDRGIAYVKRWDEMAEGDMRKSEFLIPNS
jgi:membrane protein implicated in regulation of membrane protease activity